MLDYSKSFIEEQFPVSKISKESYKERKSGADQTLTGLGKWWGRKPLVMVRAIIIGALLPVSDDYKKDRDVFLEIMGMSNNCLLRRKIKQITIKEIYKNISEADQQKYFNIINDSPKIKGRLSANDKKYLQEMAFLNLSYDDKLTYCIRSEQMSDENINWHFVNAHLETNAHSIETLVNELSIKRYRKNVVVGDCFAGGGSNVFEPARMGCDVRASDLNPIAGLLTWSDLNLIGSTPDNYNKITEFQNLLFDTVVDKIDKLEVEDNENGDIAKFYVYCNEIICPECGYKVPLLPTLVFNVDNKSIIELIEEPETKTYNFKMLMNVSEEELKQADKKGTVSDAALNCPHCRKSTSILAIRGGGDSTKIRDWDIKDFIPKDNDVFTERLYAIKYITLKDKKQREVFRKKTGIDKPFGDTYYAIPTENDLKREKKIIEYVNSHFDEWQKRGYLPIAEIENGEKTIELERSRGWKYWHQLFNPRQLMMIGIMAETISQLADTKEKYAIGMLILHKCCDSNSKLCRWRTNSRQGITENTYYNQALNTLYNYGVRSSFSLYTVANLNFVNYPIKSNKTVVLEDAKLIDYNCNIWITDPPYADAVNYSELSEFFIAWDRTLLLKAFPEWYVDSKRALAIKGTGKSFNESMVAVYSNLTKHMTDNGMQIVMFTHQDTKVWAELSMILWSAGLRVTAAWCIATETDAVGIKQGNYVKGTVLMILKKQSSEETIFKDELYEEIRDSVKEQIDSMRELDKNDNPDFTDGDYLLAAYVAALKVLTSYKNIAGLDVQYELQKARNNPENSPVTQLINIARKEANDYLVPSEISTSVWKKLTAEERFYIKGIELELKGNKQMSSYQEIARVFGIRDYTAMLANTKANCVRVKNASEYKSSAMNDEKFGSSLIRNILMAIYVSVRDENALSGRNYLKSKFEENNQYWKYRNDIMELLDYLGKAKEKENMPKWKNDSEYALMLREALRNDSI
ncbi:DUF1156 domain-containing protein [Anaerocolumna sedimenticola]|uniref:DUF1156 domain-containing protein n=1 Tax=Anaerocolumna sedimenticola TaxID=2696063 RepID=A0A6P1TSV7_9FIRM|nr:anti-phage-associated DUF1156 domain-containing protein [Anaerocolumna sedimenticola]QHQ63289.1 DUF1156 domain-containing protein [Anaerocolumna sedimenticola]